MNNSKTPKIVVGVGLAAVYATIAAFLMRDGNDNVVAQNATAPAAEIASEPALPAAVVPAPPEETASVAEQPAAPVVAATPVTPAGPVAAAPKTVEAAAPRKADATTPVAAQPIASQEPIAQERPIASVATVPPAAERVGDPSLATTGSADLEESEATGEVASQVDSVTSDGASDVSEEDAATEGEPVLIN